ncbi:hypothetical protein J6590_066067 [Homalodisca vitripennis]|nr:hypothetical protein J6590_066067 [Homalodisca vitripennis]
MDTSETKSCTGAWSMTIAVSNWVYAEHEIKRKVHVGLGTGKIILQELDVDRCLFGSNYRTWLHVEAYSQSQNSPKEIFLCEQEQAAEHLLFDCLEIAREGFVIFGNIIWTRVMNFPR